MSDGLIFEYIAVADDRHNPARVEAVRRRIESALETTEIPSNVISDIAGLMQLDVPEDEQQVQPALKAKIMSAVAVVMQESHDDEEAWVVLDNDNKRTLVVVDFVNSDHSDLLEAVRLLSIAGISLDIVDKCWTLFETVFPCSILESTPPEKRRHWRCCPCGSAAALNKIREGEHDVDSV